MGLEGTFHKPNKALEMGEAEREWLGRLSLLRTLGTWDPMAPN